MLRHALCLSVLALSLGPLARAQDAVAPTVIVETADGSLLVGTLPPTTELTLVVAGAKTRLAIRDIRRLAISSFREPAATALEAEVLKLRDRLGAGSYRVREEASAALAAMTGPIAPFVSALAKDADPEIAARARAALATLASRGELHDARDVVVLEKEVVRGWLELEALELVTPLGTVSIPRGELRAVRHPDEPEVDPRTDHEAQWPPPPFPERAVLPRQLAISLLDGSCLVGAAPPEALALTDGEGRPLGATDVVSIVRDPDAPGFFDVTRKDVRAVKGKLAAPEIALAGALRAWKIPVATIQSIEIGAHRRGGSGTMAALVQAWLRASKHGGKPPTQRFWTHIDGQPANPWNSAGRKGMTWSLRKVHEQVALVGADESTDAYRGDTSIDEVLPILCLKKRSLPAPPGVDPTDFYNGWSGGEIRLSKPVSGKLLTSLEATNALIREQFGEGWEIGEHHSPSGGWHWWGYWGKVPEEKK